jgi:hypothetical protein
MTLKHRLPHPGDLKYRKIESENENNSKEGGQYREHLGQRCRQSFHLTYLNQAICREVNYFGKYEAPSCLRQE